jgi:hypothetical protein
MPNENKVIILGMVIGQLVKNFEDKKAIVAKKQ